jgi:hypothetical protein
MKGMLVSLCSTLFGLVMLTIAPVAMAGDPVNCSGGMRRRHLRRRLLHGLALRFDRLPDYRWLSQEKISSGSGDHGFRKAGRFQCGM